MSTATTPESAVPAKFTTPLLLALIAGGIVGNYLNFPIFHNLDFIFGSIFALLALQFFGLWRGLLAAIIIAGYTFILWNHPYAIIILSAEMATVGWLMAKRKMRLLVADTLYWLIIGIPMIYLFYRVVMHVEPSSVYIIMIKQALNGIANALVARLIFTAYVLRRRIMQTSYREVIYNLFAFFVLFPTLFILAVDSRSEFAVTNRHIIESLNQEAQVVDQRLKAWVKSRETAIASLAELAAEKSPQQMQGALEQAKKADINFLRIGLVDRDAKSIAFFPLRDEQGLSTIGRNFADRHFIPTLKQTLRPILSEVVLSRIGTPKPMVALLAPVVTNGAYAGYVIGVLDLTPLQEYFDTSANANTLRYTLIDNSSNVIMTNRADLKVMAPFLRGQGTLRQLEQGVSQWIPLLPPNTPRTVGWRKSFYLKEISIGGPEGWKAILELPVAPFQNALNESFTHKLFFLFLFFLCGLALAELLSRRLLTTLIRLRALTRDLPVKLARADHEIVWPQSSMYEADDLIHNFRNMAISLTDKFNEIELLNRSLEQRIAARTAELRQSRDEWKNTFDCLPDMIAILDLNYHILHANKAMLETMSQGGKVPLVTEPCYKVFHNLEAPPAECPHTRLLCDGLPHKQELFDHLSNRHLFITETPLYNAENSLIGSIHIARDISERIRIDEELADLIQEVAARNKFVESVITNLQSGILVVDLELRIILANNYVSEIYDQSDKAFIGRHLAEICPELHANILDGKTVDELAVNFCCTPAFIGYNCTDLTDAAGQPIGSIVLFKDLTEVVRIRKELRQKERLAAMGEALAGVAHEMRNPLFGITSAAQILEFELQLNPDQKKLMDSLMKEARRLNNLIEELLDSTRETRIRKSRVNMTSILDESLRSVSTQMQEKGISLRKSYDEDVWLAADYNKLVQVIVNLATNAIDASGPAGYLIIDVSCSENDVVVKIADTGEGILPENLDRIFDIFFTTKKNGTGLGLPICRAIVEAHGGSLTASNNQFGGAQLVIQLPRGVCP